METHGNSHKVTKGAFANVYLFPCSRSKVLPPIGFETYPSLRLGDDISLAEMVHFGFLDTVREVTPWRIAHFSDITLIVNPIRSGCEASALRAT